jgi:hypothetical protein
VIAQLAAEFRQRKPQNVFHGGVVDFLRGAVHFLGAGNRGPTFM